MVADEAFGRQIPFTVLERIAEDFVKTHGAAAADALAHSLDRQFGPRLKHHLEYAAEHPEELNKVSKVQKQVTEVKEIMMENIEKVLDRGEKIELLVDKTTELRFQADNFHRTGRALRRRMWWQNLKLKLAVGAVVVVILLIIIMMICFSGGQNHCK